MKNRVPIFAFIALNTAVYLLYIFYYNFLPDTMASHFGFSSQPDGWSSKASFVITFLAIQTITSLIFLGIYLIIPKVDPNLPNKEYYMAPERKEHTIAVLQGSVLTIANLTMLLLVIASFFVFQVNINGSSFLAPLMNYIVGVYIICVIISAVRLIFRFKRIS